MGLLDFAANIGKKLFGDDDEDAGEKVEQHIEEDNPGIDDLKVVVKDGVATMSGKANDQSAYEKAILMAGNVLGIKEVKADGLESPPAAQKVEYYEIKKGDTLWAISSEFLGSGARYTEIAAANLEVIKDADKIYPGQKIRIPLD